MLASPANQLTDAETTNADKQARTANLLTLEFSGAQHEPVLLSPGKWRIGSGTTNQIVLDDVNIAANQFLIIVTEHRSVIRDWSTKAFWNGNLFENAVLEDGDTVEVADVRMSFRLARSQELISQLPYVAEVLSHDEAEGATGTDGADRLDELIRRIESSSVSDSSETVNFDSDVTVLRSTSQDVLSPFDFETSASASDNCSVGPQPDRPFLDLQAARMDEELRQLEELRSTVQLDREQLLAKRELLVQETQRAESQIADARRTTENHSVKDEAAAVDADGFEFAEPSVVDSAMHDEDRVVAAEREKLRYYLEGFESVDDAECEQLAEVTVAVGAAQAVADYSTMNALRSRDDAVKQLDELVLAATRGLSAQPTAMSTLLFDPVTTDRASERSGSSASPASDESELMRHCDEHSHSEASVEVDDIPELETSDLDASIDELGALIDEVEPEATLANEESNELSAHESLSSSDDLETENVEALTESASDESPASDDAVASAASDRLDLSALTTGIDVETEESSAEHTDGADFADSDLVLESVDCESLSTISGSRSDDMDSDAEVAGLNPDQLHEERPSWFDSKLMTEGDSVVDEQLDDNPSMMDAAAAEDGTSSTVDESAGDLRRRLAEMFDLPTLSERTRSVASDDSAWPGLQRIRAGIPADESAEADGDFTGSSWTDADGEVDCSETDSVTSFDPASDSSAESDREFESETLDEFPSTVFDERVASAEPTGSTFVPDEQGEAEDSISAYMERLLARNRQVTGGSSASTEASVKVPSATPEVVLKAASDLTDNGVEETAVSRHKSETWLEVTPRHRQNREQVRAEVQVLRQIANQSARSAVATASRRDVRKQVMVKTTASVLAIGSGVAALLLDVSMLFGLVVLGIGLLFSLDLALTIFRNWKQLRDLRKAAVALKGKARTSDTESTGETA